MLEKVDKRTMLLSALRLTERRFRGQPVWYAISEICDIGSNSSHDIAREIGIEPNAKVSTKVLRDRTATDDVAFADKLVEVFTKNGFSLPRLRHTATQQGVQLDNCLCCSGTGKVIAMGKTCVCDVCWGSGKR